MPRSAYVCVLPTVLPALAWPPTAPRRSGELIMHGTAMLYLLAACTGRHVLCALHTLVEQRRGPARLAQLSWPSRGAPGYPAPLHGVSGLWVNLVVLLHALHARQPLYWVTSTALGSSWRSQLFPPPSRPYLRSTSNAKARNLDEILDASGTVVLRLQQPTPDDVHTIRALLAASQAPRLSLILP